MNICTWVCEEKTEETLFPQNGRTISPPLVKNQQVRWKNAAVFFASSVRHNPGARHVLFTNVEQIPVIRGFDLGWFLTDKLKVDIRRLPAASRTPIGYNGMKRTYFYLFDIIRNIAAAEKDEHAKYAVMDPACVWIRSSAIIQSQLDRYGLLTMAVEEPGSRAHMQEIFEQMSATRILHPPACYGSECFAATAAEIRRLVPELDGVWNVSMDRFRRQRDKLSDAAEMLSYIYFKLGYRAATANPFIRRIRTKLGGIHNAQKDDRFLTVWHLPDEVKLGIPRLFQDIVRSEPLFWKGRPEAYRRYIARRLGIPHRSGVKMMRDVPHLVVRMLLNRES